MNHDIIRTCIFRPYQRGQGPWFKLVVWDTGKCIARGTTDLGFRLTQHNPTAPKCEVIFEGDGFSPSPMDGDDSDACMQALMGFLTLRPGDTDRDYFENYTPRQMEFAQQHAETLAVCVYDRWRRD